MDWQAILLTVKLASITSFLLILIATPIAWWLSRWKHPMRSLVHAIIALPLVLPPTVLGFYLLVAFSPDNWFGGAWFSLTGATLAFSFTGILIGSIIYSLPFAVQPLFNSFQSFENGYLDVARTMRLTRAQQFFFVLLPATKGAFITAIGLSFAHTLGEFGVILMIGGNIPGETRVVSIALFDYVEALNYENAHALALFLLVFSLILLSILYRFSGKKGSSWT